MENFWVYQILNNASIAGTISVCLGLFGGRIIYRKQKEFDKKISDIEKISEDLFFFEQHCRAADELAMDQLPELWIKTENGDEKENIDLLEEAVNKLSDLLFEKVYVGISKIQGRFWLFPYGTNKVNEARSILIDSYTEWNIFILKHIQSVQEKGKANIAASNLSAPFGQLEDSIRKLQEELRKSLWN